MIFPNYKRSVVNVAASVIDAFGGKPEYLPLKELDTVKKYSKVVLMSIDGLGYEFLQKYGKDSFLSKNCVAKITSTFPATTAGAELALETGVAPQQHAITGWYMLIKELGTVARVLLFEPRFAKKCKFPSYGVNYNSIFSEKKIFQKIGANYSLIMPEIILDDYKLYERKKLLPFDNLPGFIRQIKKAAGFPGPRLIYAYWIWLDYICHQDGCDGAKTRKHLADINGAVQDLAEFLKKKNVCLIITADHGLTDVAQKNIIQLNDYEEIYGCLALPLCGDTRAPYCYVRPDRVATFKKLVKEQLGFCCKLHKSLDFIKKGVFGVGKPNPKLYERVGDYILVCKDGYLIRDALINEKYNNLRAFHGGMSGEEMFVPLIIVYPQ